MRGERKIAGFTNISLPALLALAVLQMYFYFSTTHALGLPDFLRSSLFSLLFFLKISLGLWLIYALFLFLSTRIARIVLASLYLLILGIHFLLLNYLLQTGIPLGADLFGYSLQEILDTVRSSSGSSLPLLASGLACFGIYLFGVLHCRKIPYRVPAVLGLIMLPTCFISIWLPTFPDSNRYTNESRYFLVANPSLYFFSKSFALLQDQETADQNLTQYPFLKTRLPDNPLATLVPKKSSYPNLVFIVVEGLGADFCGPDALYGGATPFLDSLAQKSLYWTNCLSNAGRTFGALPDILGSLPYEGIGFMGRGAETPTHLTLFSWLRASGYHTSFYYGGNANFDGQDVFLEQQHTDFILDENKIPKHYPRIGSNNEGFSWGYADKGVFEYGLSLERQSPTPRASFYLTLSTHEPFHVPDSSLLRQVQMQFARYTGEKREVFLENENVFACLRYADESVRYLLKAYQSLPNYENTLFIITGDHRLVPIPTESPLQRFHVPLLIYTPGISPRQFDFLAAHSQLPPTLMNYLSGTYGLAAPAEVSFISGPLPTETGFGSTLELPLMRNKNEMDDYISGTYLLSGQDLFRIADDLTLSPLKNPAVKKSLQRKMQHFKTASKLALQENRLLPDSLAISSISQEFTLDEKAMTYLQANGLLQASPDQLYFTARDLAFDKSYVSCRTLLKHGLNSSPNYHDMRVLLGRTYAWAGVYDSAYLYLDQVLARAGNYEDAYIAYADAAYWADDPDRSLHFSMKGLEAYPQSQELKSRAARAYLEKRDTQNARILVNEVLASDSDHELALQIKKRLTDR